jgi:hypothetical protein
VGGQYKKGCNRKRKKERNKETEREKSNVRTYMKKK